MAKSNIGHIAPFTKEKDNFENYVEKVQLFFLANNVQEGRKVPALLTLLEGETYELLKGLVAPTPPAELTFDAICNALKRHLCPAPRVIPERAKFFKRLQSEHETVADYNAALRKLASTCKNRGETSQNLGNGFGAIAQAQSPCKLEKMFLFPRFNTILRSCD